MKVGILDERVVKLIYSRIFLLHFWIKDMEMVIDLIYNIKSWWLFIMVWYFTCYLQDWDKCTHTSQIRKPHLWSALICALFSFSVYSPSLPNSWKVPPHATNAFNLGRWVMGIYFFSCFAFFVLASLLQWFGLVFVWSKDWVFFFNKFKRLMCIIKWCYFILFFYCFYFCRCKHYRRRCKIRAPCCNEIFSCRHCHNEATVFLLVHLVFISSSLFSSQLFLIWAIFIFLFFFLLI